MRILVVEDEADLNLLLCKVLTRAGYTVDGCMDGEEAELHLMGAEYDGILLDVMLPKKDGYTLVQELRAKGADTPVLFLTARDSVADRVRGLDLGGDDYLVKPFDFDELLARIRAALRKRTAAAPPPANTLTVGGVVLDTDRHTVTVQGTQVELTRREFDLLHYLLENKEKVVSRESLRDHVGGYDYAGETNAVDVYIRFLRAKLEEPFGEKFIHTVRGVGYVIREQA